MVNDKHITEPSTDNSDMKKTNNPAIAAEARNRAFGEEVHNMPNLERDSGDADVVGSDEVAGTLTACRGSGFRSNGTVVEGLAFTRKGPRRFTPRECERLMGFPDDFTLIPFRNKPAADSPRYKALGNSIVVPILSYLGHRIAKAFSVDRLTGTGPCGKSSQ